LYSNITSIISLYHFNRFPADEVRKKRWIVAIRRLDNETKQLWEPYNGAVVCSEHFHPSDFSFKWGRKTLRPDAVPSIFTFAALSKNENHQQRGIHSATLVTVQH
jgi:hypothetical protein